MKTKRRKFTKEEKHAFYQESLSRACNPLGSLTNYPAIINGFIAKGIPEDEILPRENCFTFNAWRALGRTVKRGEHGVRVVTFRKEDIKEENPDGSIEYKVKSRPWYATVFHISLTELIKAG